MQILRYALALIVLLFAVPTYAKPKTPALKYVDACSLTVINKAMPTSLVWHRADSASYPAMNKSVRRLYSYPSGMSVVFRTDSRYIYARWRTLGRKQSTNIPAIAQRGLDLYIKDGDRWLYAGVGKPDVTDHQSQLCAAMDTTMKECMVNLPIYDELFELEIGVAPDAVIKPIDNPYQKRVLVAGSSITNGSGVSRPGMTYGARIGRALGVETPNLGASGRFKLEPFFADIIADIDADAFIFDAFSNSSAELIRERLLPFVEAVRKAHPAEPLIFLNTVVRPKGNFNLKVRAEEAAKRLAAEEMMSKVMEKYDGVYFINPGMPIGDDGEGSADGIHPTDMGFDRMLGEIIPRIEEILRSHGVIE